MMGVSRSMRFALAAAGLCFISGLMMPTVMGVRAAILGAAIACGARLMVRLERDSGRVWLALGGGALAGAAGATLAVWGWSLLNPEPLDELGLTMLPPFWTVFAICLVQGLLLLQTYRARASKGRLWGWLVLAAAGGATVRSLAISDGLAAVPFCLIVGNLPFSLLWVLAAWLSDPEWNRAAE